MNKHYMKSKTDEKCEEKTVQCITITKKKEQLCSVCRFFTFPYSYTGLKTDSRSVDKKATPIATYIKLRTLCLPNSMLEQLFW